ncbi:receptor-like cytosolic serine/threonine-protein kinase RBK2 isoform X2 [Eucalyptus grandis]|uniref:receptor-like cytosolic serine/threonine-protein kinase RBK2 isoform X2 n=1 Tax=Eucalyptus grandis TaxID=71139 RepID=UPI00192ED40D|nr:receptor-like cytosolic serine/threonine-protein kinase RBK2 isoform X2 [Eucalyptus grandis]
MGFLVTGWIKNRFLRDGRGSAVHGRWTRERQIMPAVIFTHAHPPCPSLSLSPCDDKFAARILCPFFFYRFLLGLLRFFCRRLRVMEDVREDAVPSRNGPAITAREIQEEEEKEEEEEEEERERLRVKGKKCRAGFSDSISSHDLRSLEMEGRADDSSPRGVFEDDLSGVEPSVTSPASTSSSECHSFSKGSNNKWRGFLRTLKKGSPVRFHTFPLKSVPKLTRRKSTRIREDMVPAFHASLDTELGDLSYFKPSWRNFTLIELQDATDNFSRDNLIGEGGCAEVYKGMLPGGEIVAIKRLTRGSPEEMTADFLSELGIIVHVDHPNIAKLIGYGVEGGMHLILHLSPHGSLASLLYGSGEKLDWGIRYKVALGTAEGLMYLHEECQRRIIHKDVKAANILLSEDFEPQISDFGLAKWLPEQWSHHIVSQIEGTFGYLPPEYFMHGIVDEKTDVYAYGVLLLELITGQKALDSSQKSLVMWAKPLLSDNRIKEFVDPSLGGAYNSEQMDRLILAASLCTHHSSIHRPQMSQVVCLLRGEQSSLELAREQDRGPLLQRTYSEELYAAEEYNATKYLNDLDRYMEIVQGLTKECRTE